jgi:hypothetical protein
MNEKLSVEGLTLRDYLAGQVLTAAPWDYTANDAMTIARSAYEVADAMLIVRNEPPIAQRTQTNARTPNARPSDAERAHDTPALNR